MLVKLNRKILAILIILMMICIAFTAISLAKSNYTKVGDPDDVDDPDINNGIDYRINHACTAFDDGGDPDEYLL